MATSKKNGNEGVIYLALILFIPFLLFSAMRYSLIKDSHLNDESNFRIMDFAVTNRVLIPAGLCMIFLFSAIKSDSGITFGSILIIIFLILLSILLSLRLAVVYAGVMVNDEKDKISFPPDIQSFGITDYFSSKLIEYFYNINAVKLSIITKMTREAGKKLFIHGKFGSRCLVFSSKQKRDECIALIQDSDNYQGQKIYDVAFEQ